MAPSSRVAANQLKPIRYQEGLTISQLQGRFEVNGRERARTRPALTFGLSTWI